MTGICDVRTGKIIGVKKNSLSYWHEKGHIKFAKTDLGMRNQFYMDHFLILTILFLVISSLTKHIYFKLLPLAGIFLYFALYFYEEVWCWRFIYVKKFFFLL